MASDFDAMRLADLLEHEARAHGPTDYKHKAAAMLRSLATQPTASNAGERAPTDTLSFICTNGCGYCGVKLRDFVTHATQAQDSDTWVTVASEPEIVSTCCGHPVEVWDERKQDVVAEVRAALATKPTASAEQAEAPKRLPAIYSASVQYARGGPCQEINLQAMLDEAYAAGKAAQPTVRNAGERVAYRPDEKTVRADLLADRERQAGEAVARPDILEKLTYHALERDDLTLDDCLDFLAHEWRKVHGRTDRQMVLQILSLLASHPAPQAVQADDVDRLLREVFVLCEATEEAPETEPKNEHQRGFERGRRFEAKSIRKAIGAWFQDEFCGRSFMGEPITSMKPEWRDMMVGAHEKLTAAPSPEASKAEQAEAPSDWRETIQGAIDELPYQHYLIPRLVQLLTTQPGAVKVESPAFTTDDPDLDDLLNSAHWMREPGTGMDVGLMFSDALGRVKKRLATQPTASPEQAEAPMNETLKTMIADMNGEIEG